MDAVDEYAADVVGWWAAVQRGEDAMIPQARMTASYRVVINRAAALRAGK